MRVCCLCKKKDIKGTQNGVFFKFPMDARRRNKWITACGEKFYTNSFVCQDHFQTSDYRATGGKVKLMPNAVPSLQPFIKECAQKLKRPKIHLQRKYNFI